MAPQLVEKGCKVLDLSADYRFSDLETYITWYGGRSDRTVGNTFMALPELYRDRIAESQLIGCPGCYPQPVSWHSRHSCQGLIVPETAIIDAKSGTSGGGRVAVGCYWQRRITPWEHTALRVTAIPGN